MVDMTDDVPKNTAPHPRAQPTRRRWRTWRQRWCSSPSS